MLNLIKKTHSLLILIFLFTFNACSNEPDVKTAFAEVMAVHDEVMPLISNMKKDKRELLSIKEKAETPPEQIQQIEEAVDLLTQGDSLMFAWMENFKMPEENTPKKEVLSYLASEKIKIQSVSNTMKDGMEKAKNILSELKTE